ncbi:MAG: hypothetical protein RMN51_06900 [Verrucomicrobiota bacterium]|nr:hypothetical protein [Limisphaera sp.]MDW8381820.1 hypothetical protein [Verrucomicrobiota bacterium]
MFQAASDIYMREGPRQYRWSAELQTGTMCFLRRLFQSKVLSRRSVCAQGTASRHCDLISGVRISIQVDKCLPVPSQLRFRQLLDEGAHVAVDRYPVFQEASA